jgi:protease-4
MKKITFFRTGGRMRAKITSLILLVLFFAACAPHFHLDFLGEGEMQEVSLKRSRAKEKILVIDISGIISSSLSPGLFEREGDIISKIYSRLEKASSDKWVEGIILRLDTPGGEVTASDILYNEILSFKKRTGVPVVALMMGIAASGGYYIASACDTLIAHPSTLTGSIGVISIFPNLEELLVKIGVKVDVIKSGAMKDSGSSFRDMTDKERSIFQEIVDEFYKKFLDVVYKNRKELLTRITLKDIADGRIYTAQQALELKLIDEIGYFDTALKKVMSQAQISEANIIAYTYYPKTKTNIYATSLNKTSPFDDKNIEDIFRSFKSGVYYLWLPQLFP